MFGVHAQVSCAHDRMRAQDAALFEIRCLGGFIQCYSIYLSTSVVDASCGIPVLMRGDSEPESEPLAAVDASADHAALECVASAMMDLSEPDDDEVVAPSSGVGPAEVAAEPTLDVAVAALEASHTDLLDPHETVGGEDPSAQVVLVFVKKLFGWALFRFDLQFLLPVAASLTASLDEPRSIWQ